MDTSSHGTGWRLALRYAVSDGVPSRSLRVALLVGTVLNLINQGEAIVGAAPVDWLKLGLTFAMPYAVSTYGAVAFRLGERGRPRPSAEIEPVAERPAIRS